MQELYYRLFKQICQQKNWVEAAFRRCIDIAQNFLDSLVWEGK